MTALDGIDQRTDDWLMLFGDKQDRLNYALDTLRHVSDNADDNRRFQMLSYWDRGIGEQVAYAIHSDARLLVRGEQPTQYQRHLRKQARAQARRKETMQAERELGVQRPRDSQRKKLYRAEHVTRHSGRRFDTVHDVTAYVDKLVSSAWFQRRWKVKRITVGDGRGRRNAAGCSYLNRIYLPRWARTEDVVLHEIAHVCTGNQYGRLGAAAHGWQFAAIFLELVGHCMGDEAARKLQASFRTNKVRFRKPRTLSPEQRAAAIERLAKAREARANG